MKVHLTPMTGVGGILRFTASGRRSDRSGRDCALLEHHRSPGLWWSIRGKRYMKRSCDPCHRIGHSEAASQKRRPDPNARPPRLRLYSAWTAGLLAPRLAGGPGGAARTRVSAAEAVLR